MTIQAYIVNQDRLQQAIGLVLLDQRAPGDTRALQVADAHRSTWEPLIDGINIAPTITMPIDAARALLNALAEHFGGTTSVIRLRADYDAALQRADAQAAVIADVVRTLAAKVSA